MKPTENETEFKTVIETELRKDIEKIVGYCGHCNNGVEVVEDENGDPTPINRCICTKRHDDLLALITSDKQRLLNKARLEGECYGRLNEHYVIGHDILSNADLAALSPATLKRLKTRHTQLKADNSVIQNKLEGLS